MAYSYSTAQYSLTPTNASPKNNIIVGVQTADDSAQSHVVSPRNESSPVKVLHSWSASRKILRRILASSSCRDSLRGQPITHGNHVLEHDMLQHKVSLLSHHFRHFLRPADKSRPQITQNDIEVFASPLTGHRLRVRFGIRVLPRVGLTFASFANGVSCLDFCGHGLCAHNGQHCANAGVITAGVLLS